MLLNSVVDSMNKESMHTFFLQRVDYLHQDEEAVLRGFSIESAKTSSLCFEKCSYSIFHALCNLIFLYYLDHFMANI